MAPVHPSPLSTVHSHPSPSRPVVAPLTPESTHNEYLDAIKALGHELLLEVPPGTRMERLLSLVWMTIFLLVWLASCLYPVIMLWALCSTDTWIITAIMGLQWWIIKVPLANSIESELFKQNGIALFLKRQFSNLQVYSSTTVSCPSNYPICHSHTNPVIYPVHPHGIFCCGWGVIQQVPAMGNLLYCASDFLYASPVFFIWCNLFNRHGGVQSDFIKSEMTQRSSLALIPGGYEEATIHSSSEDRVYLQKRKGFVALAIRYDYTIRPIFTFGERTTYRNAQCFLGLRLLLNRLPVQIPGIFPFGRRMLFPLLPRRSSRIHVVIGEPIKFDRCDKPTREMVDSCHQKYISNLQSMYRDLAPILDPRENLEYELNVY